MLTGYTLPDWFAAGLGLTLYMAAFSAEIFRAGVISIDRGQWEASTVLGFSYVTKMRHIILPLRHNRDVLGLLFMLPAAVFLLCFLTYPLGLGVWLGFTDTTIGRDGIFIGLENYQFLWDDSVFWLSVFNTVLYTFVASVLKFALGLWLALLLNENLPI